MCASWATNSTDEITSEAAAAGRVALWEMLPDVVFSLSPEEVEKLVIAVYRAMRLEYEKSDRGRGCRGAESGRQSRLHT